MAYEKAYNITSAIEEDRDTVERLYQVYSMQNYLADYLSAVSQLTVDNASNLFDMKYPVLQSIPYFQAIISIVLVLVAFSFSGLFTGTIVPEPGSSEAETLADIQVPAFLLQPLIENAFIHGIAKEEKGGKIIIRAEKKDNALHIAVSDTGAGMDSKTLQGLRDKLKGEPSDVRVGIGIGNLYQRLNTLYGEDSLRIESEAGKGTQIFVTIPLSSGETYNDKNIGRR